MKIFSGNANQALAKDIAAYLGINLGRVKVRVCLCEEEAACRDTRRLEGALCFPACFLECSKPSTLEDLINRSTCFFIFVGVL